MYNVNAYQIAAAISIEDCRLTLPWERLFSDSNELFYKIGEEKFLCVFQYGIVGCFNLSNESKKGVLKELKQFCSDFIGNRFYKEMNVEINNNDRRISCDKIVLSCLSVETVRMIVLNIVQVVALDNYDEVTKKWLTKIRSHNAYLERYGKLNISDKKVKQYIGSVYLIKYWITENRCIYDSHEGTWKSKDLNVLNLELKETFCLRERFRNTNHQMVMLEENLQLFKDILNQKESSRLEWIIIILIAIEIVDLFVMRIF